MVYLLRINHPDGKEQVMRMGFFDRFIKPDRQEGTGETRLQAATAGKPVPFSNKDAALSDGIIPDFETDLNVERVTDMPMEELATLGPAVASLLPAFRTVSQTSSVDMKGLYRLANAEAGDALKLAKNGNFWGAFKKPDGTSKFAQLVQAGPAEATSTTVMPLDPATIMMAVALYSIERKLDSVLEMQKKILSFLETEKEAQIEADVKVLGSTLREFKFNWDREIFINAHYKQALDVKRTAEKNLRSYQKEVRDFKTNVPLMANANINAAVKDMLRKFRYYRMSLYVFSMASFLEMLLLGDYREEHILKVREDIEERSMKYREIYGACSEYVEKIAGKSVEANVLKGIGNAGKVLGGLIGSIPLVKEGPVDEWLAGSGEALKGSARDMERDPVKVLVSVSNPETGVFLEKMDDLNRIYNHTSRICFDNEKVYLIADEAEDGT